MAQYVVRTGGNSAFADVDARESLKIVQNLAREFADGD